MEATKLERLLISEVSGVDDPANQLPGWRVLKAAGDEPDLLLALAGEMEVFTKAAADKTPYGDVTYADPGYQEDGKKRYPLDSETHIRAAWSYINQAGNADLYSADDLSKVKAKIQAAMKKIGAEVSTTKSAETVDSNSTIVAKIKGILLGSPTGKDDLEMDKAELTAILDERDEALVQKVAEAVSASVPVPAEGEGATEPEAGATASAESSEAPALTAEDITKAIQEALAPYNEILEGMLDRTEAIESALGVAARKSLDGQETNEDGTPVEKSAPNLSDAISSRVAKARGGNG